jgi:hypothetical protein
METICRGRIEGGRILHPRAYRTPTETTGIAEKRTDRVRFAPVNRPTLAVALALLVVLLVSAVFVHRANEGAERAVAANRQELDVAAVDRAADAVTADLEKARATLDGVRRAVRDGAVTLDDPTRLGLDLHATLVDDPMIVSVAFTRAVRSSFGADGRTSVATDPRWEIAAVRPDDDDTHVLVHRVARGGGGWVDDAQKQTLGRPSPTEPFRRLGDAPDPTGDAAFVAAADKQAADLEIWRDLSYAAADAALPEAQRRVVVTVARSILDADGTFVGVVRVDRMTHAPDEVAHADVNHADERDVFVCDADGGLLTRGNQTDSLAPVDGWLRVATPPSPAIAESLRSPLLQPLSPDGGAVRGPITVQRSEYAATFRALRGSEPWIVGAVSPAGRGVRQARETSRQANWALAALGVGALVAIGAALRLGKK